MNRKWKPVPGPSRQEQQTQDFLNKINVLTQLQIKHLNKIKSDLNLNKSA